MKSLIRLLKSTALISLFLPQVNFHLPLRRWEDVPAIAGIVQGYIPPFDRPFLQRTEGSGSRGCEQDTDVFLHLLAPANHVATTVSSRPTLLWYVSDVSYPVNVTLIEKDGIKPILEREIKPKAPGIIAFKIPSTTPSLIVNKQYQWTVSIVCNRKKPSKNIYAQAIFERIDVPPQLQHKSKISNELQKAEFYGKSGIWYESIAILSKLYTANPNDKKVKESLFKILNQSDVELSGVANRLASQPKK